MLVFFYLQRTLNRLFNNFISYIGIGLVFQEIRNRGQTDPLPEKTSFKKPIGLKLQTSLEKFCEVPITFIPRIYLPGFKNRIFFGILLKFSVTRNVFI